MTGMNATEAYRAMLRDQVDPALRAQGFKGSGNQWSLSNEHGDVGIVGAQASVYGTKDDLRFIINLALVPQPWWDWERVLYRLPQTRKPRYSHGPWHRRLRARADSALRGSEAWWSVRDVASAARCGEDVVAQLLDEAVPQLQRWSPRAALVQALRDGDVGPLRRDAHLSSLGLALAALLADEGGGASLDALVVEIESDIAQGHWQGEWIAFPDWLRQRVADSPRGCDR